VTHAVLLARPESFDAVALSKVIGQFKNIPSIDAVVEAKQSWGVVAESLPEDRVKALKALLDAAAMPAVVVLTSAIVKIPAPVWIAKIQWGADRLECRSKKEEAFVLTKDSLEMIAACAINEDHTRTIQVREGPTAGQRIASMGIMMATGLPIHIGPKSQTIEKKEHRSELLFFLDLFERERKLHLRIDAQKFDYSFLKEKKQYSVLMNMKTLLRELAAFAPAAAQSRGTQILLKDKPIVEMGYQSLDDLDRESRWLLTLKNAL